MKKDNFIWLMFSLLLPIAFYSQKLNTVNLNKLLEQADKTNTEAVIIYHKGKIVCEKYFHTGKPGQVIEAMSATKSIVGMAILKLLSDGKIDSLDVPVHAFFPEWDQGNKKLITLRMLLDHTSGLQNQLNAEVEIYPSPDFVKLALAAELSDIPGTKFSYNNKALNLVSGIIQKVSGKRMDVYIKENIFAPLGITNYYWQLDSAGNAHGLAGCQITPADLAKLGLLMLNKGLWEGKELIAEKWILKSTLPSKLNSEYGLLWWLVYKEVSFSVTDQHVSAMQKADLDPEFIQKVKSLVGDYKTEKEYEDAKVKIFGSNANIVIMEKVFSKGLNIRDKKFKDQIGYAARGFLGNYLVVLPDKDMVGVRMISGESTDGRSEDYFKEFDLLLNSLIN